MPTIGIAKRIPAIGIIAVDLDPLVDILMDMTLHGRLSKNAKKVPSIWVASCDVN